MTPPSTCAFSPVRAVGWYTQAHHGGITPDAPAWCASSQSPDLAGGQALVGKPVKYFQRMTDEARHALCATSLALRAIHPHWLDEQAWPVGRPTAGLLAGCIQGTLAADLRYFTDYLATGRTLARGNLFVYTLPTSVVGAVSVELHLTGPAWFVQEERTTPAALLAQGRAMIRQQQADLMLILWSDPHAAVCLAVTGGPDPHPALPDLMHAADAPTPLALADALATHAGGVS